MESKQNIDKMLRKIAKEIEISKTEYEKAVKSYNAVGTFIDNNIPQYDIKVVPQGSFRLGTVIKPITDKDEYDIDLVAIIDHKFLNAKAKQNGEILRLV